jgi:hypothetical protein
MNKFNIGDIVKFKNENDTYGVFKIQYCIEKDITYELHKITSLNDNLPYVYDDVPEESLIMVSKYDQHNNGSWE